MAVKVFKTLVKQPQEYGRRDFVLGRLDGLQYAICGGYPNKGYPIKWLPNGDHVMTVECEEFRYENFTKVAEGMYTGLCEFYYKEE